MSQNSIISIVIVVLAIVIGVYFYFTSGSQNVTPIYDGDLPSSVETKNEAQDPTPIEPVLPKSEVTKEESSRRPTITADSNTSQETETATSSINQQKSAPIIVKNTYEIVVTGSVSQYSGEFIIKANEVNGSSVEFKQDTLKDTTYMIESEKVFTSFSVDIKNYVPITKDNIELFNHKATVSIELEAYSQMTGSVKSFLEKPISGAIIVVEKGAYKKILHTNANGEFNVNEQILAGQYSLAVNHPSFDSKRIVVEVGKGEEKTVSIKLERDAIFEGNVITSEGKVAAGLEGVLKHESDASKNKEVRTNEKGEFSLANIEEGKYTLEFNSMLGSLVEPLAFVRNVEMVRALKLLPPPSIGGVIIDEKGKPVVGLKIFTYDDKSMLEDTTLAEGKFNLVLEKKGDYRVLVNSEDYEMVNSSKLYSPSLDKIVLQVKKREFVKGKILSTSGRAITKNYTMKLYNKTRKSEISIFSFIQKEDKVFIPLATFKFIEPNDEVQILVDSPVFGKGASLVMKASALNIQDEFIITIGD